MNATKTAITPTRAENFADWYQEVIRAADLAEHSPVRGCMIIKPWGYAIWENIQRALDKMIKDTGHQNAYFPLLIPLSFLAKEAAHVEGFAKECAVVTHYRLETDKDGKLVPAPSAELTEPLVIRPTSETTIGHAMSRWVQSYNDLPLLLNQWCNVMRWEMRTRLFLRTAEFLWQEGHTAHATAEEAQVETLKMLDVYETLLQDFLAIPVIKGEKTAGERFPGADHTYAIETMSQDGKAIQAGTSHFLGQNFSKAYEIKFTDRDQNMAHAWTTSWGTTTRLIGSMIMAHSDDDGLVLPPRISPDHIVLIPFAMKDADLDEVLAECSKLADELRTLSYHNESIRVSIDKTSRRSGDKFWNAVKRGIPLRLEVGLRDLQANSFPLSRRDKPAKEKISLTRDALLTQVPKILDEIQSNLLQRALKFRTENTRDITSSNELESLFGENEDAGFKGFAMAFFDVECEKSDSVAETLKRLKLSVRCVPLADKGMSGTCIFTGKQTSQRVILARAY